jgi:hypothetical protein
MSFTPGLGDVLGLVEKTYGFIVTIYRQVKEAKENLREIVARLERVRHVSTIVHDLGKKIPELRIIVEAYFETIKEIHDDIAEARKRDNWAAAWNAIKLKFTGKAEKSSKWCSSLDSISNQLQFVLVVMISQSALLPKKTADEEDHDDHELVDASNVPLPTSPDFLPSTQSLGVESEEKVQEVVEKEEAVLPSGGRPFPTKLSEIFDFNSRLDHHYGSHEGENGRENGFYVVCKRKNPFVWRLYFIKNGASTCTLISSSPSKVTLLQRLADIKVDPACKRVSSPEAEKKKKKKKGALDSPTAGSSASSSPKRSRPTSPQVQHK